MSEHPPTDPEYEARLISHVTEILRNGPITFGSLVRRSEGAYPTDVRAVLQELRAIGQAKEVRADIWVASGWIDGESQSEDGGEPPEVASEHGELPEPHPVDFDWRFGGRTLQLIGERLATLNAHKVAILGAPTLFRYLVDHGRHPCLFDKNEHITQHLVKIGYKNVITCDLFKYSPGAIRFDCIIADPPWYVEHYRAFIDVSRAMLLRGGHLLLSVLPRLTRPSAAHDRSEVLSFADVRGFELETVEPASLEYSSPPFEREALRSEGLTLACWRLGDLYIFVKKRATSRPAPLVRVPREPELWHTYVIGRSVVKIKWDGTPGEGEFRFDAVSATGEMRLRTVSRRSPVRPQINVWTSRNIALHVSRPDVACTALQFCSETGNLGNTISAVQAIEKLSLRGIQQLTSFVTLLINESQN